MTLPALCSSRLSALQKVVNPTTFIKPYKLAKELGLELFIASESFQKTGSFKFRAAYNLAANISNELIITASSGNFGQALACACAILKKGCIVVMPDNSARVKVDATRYWGAQVDLLDTRLKSRAERVAELAAENPEAYLASAYDDELVIEGNSSLGIEIGNAGLDLDALIVPVGGGGLCSGIILGLKNSKSPNLDVFAAEPAIANDASLSLSAGRIVSFEQEAQSIADGARTLSLGKRNFEILKNSLAGLLEVPEESIKNALRRYFLEANLKVEPTGALSLAALLSHPEKFEAKKLLCVVSGANVDPQLFAELLVGFS
ncbi:MAG: pyridoxal-phosphate dependent enzyme [Candidatus Obscuribacterales bacterium]|nr:pyridoxal-phosphate dependent enzyme [Candidatus Obscuribacterales bacterium]